MPTEYITEAQMLRHVDGVKEDLSAEIDGVEAKVDDLKNLVIPLAESSKATAENTKAMRESLVELGEMNNRQNIDIARHSLEIETVKTNKAHITSLIIAVIGVIGVVITALLN